MISDKINHLFHSQLRDWELAARNYSQLDKVLTRSLGFERFEVIVQYNPERKGSQLCSMSYILTAVLILDPRGHSDGRQDIVG